MGKQELINKIDLLQTTISQKEMYIRMLESKIEVDNRKTNLDDTTHNDILKIMQNHHKNVSESYPENTFQRIFWMSQPDAAMKSSSRYFCWHPAIIKWCIFLRHKSSKAYELIRKSECICLPSQRTLRDYTYANDTSIGFSKTLDEQLVANSNVSTLEPFQKHVSLIGDEMYIKEGLVYNKHNGELIGYRDLGDINNHLLQLEKEYQNQNHVQSQQFASTMMVVMVRGLFTSFIFPYASFPTSNLTGEQLVPIFYEAIMRVELCGLKVTCITLDGHSVNRKFMKIIGHIKKNKISYKFKNPLSFNSREVFLFSDPPHLIKTARNCLATTKRNMQVNINIH